MTLGEIITRLEAENPALVLAHGFHKPHSWRGHYAELAFEPGTPKTVADSLVTLRLCVGATFEGYKGGEFTMDAGSLCHFAHYGDPASDAIGPMLLDLLISQAKNT